MLRAVVLRGSRLPLVAVVALVALVEMGGCGDSPATGVPADPAGPAPAEGVGDGQWAARLATPTPAVVLEALHQSHRTARTAWGAHHLVLDVTFTMTPDEPTSQVPAVGSRVVTPQSIVDHVELTWQGTDDDPRFRLAQHNDKDRGRDVVVADGKVYTKPDLRAWYHHPLESTIHEVWLDDAWHGVHDVVQLAAPHLQLSVDGGEGELVSLTLSRTESPNEALRADGYGQAWRNAASIEEISGTVTLERATGLWRAADIVVRYSLPDPAGRVVRGSVELRATAEPDPSPATIEVPDAQPLPQRRRQQVERARILDGLAAP